MSGRILLVGVAEDITGKTLYEAYAERESALALEASHG